MSTEDNLLFSVSRWQKLCKRAVRLKKTCLQKRRLTFPIAWVLYPYSFKYSGKNFSSKPTPHAFAAYIVPDCIP